VESCQQQANKALQLPLSHTLLGTDTHKDYESNTLPHPHWHLKNIVSVGRGMAFYTAAAAATTFTRRCHPNQYSWRKTVTAGMVATKKRGWQQQQQQRRRQRFQHCQSIDALMVGNTTASSRGVSNFYPHFATSQGPFPSTNFFYDTSNTRTYTFTKRTVTTTTTETTINIGGGGGGGEGEGLYQQAMELLHRAEGIEKEREDERSQKMYTTWQQQQQQQQQQSSEEEGQNPKKDSKRHHGVRVIKTLVKETQKDYQQKKSSNNSGNSNSNHQQQAMELLREAATIYRHPQAAVQLGNMLLNEASVRLTNNNNSRSSSSTSTSTKKQTNNNNMKNSDTTTTTIEEQLVQEAMDMFKIGGESGSRVGWYNLGQLLWTGFPPQDVDDDDENDDENGEHDVDVEEDRDETSVTVIDDNDDDKNSTIHNNNSSSSSSSSSSIIIPPNMYEAMEAFTCAIDLGDGDAMYLVGVHRLTQGGKENLHSGMKLIERAADDANHGGALYYLALLHLNGEPHMGIPPCTLEEFTVRLDKAVEAGNTDALFTRGHSYYHGTEGYIQNFPRALDDFLLGASYGHAECAVSAGAMLHHGVGVLPDQRRAFELYQLAGELGSEEGWMNVIDCWRQGLGVPQSDDTANYIEATMLKKNKRKE
jgi:TPR repeat protein